MNETILSIITEKRSEIFKNLPKIIENAALKRVDDYLAKFREMEQELTCLMTHAELILRADVQEAVKNRIKGEPDTIILSEELNARANEMAEAFIDRAAEFYTDPDKYQEL